MTNADYKELPLKEQDIAVQAVQAVPANHDCRRNKLRKLALLVVTLTLVVCTVGYFGGCSGRNNTRGFSAEEVEAEWVEDGDFDVEEHHHHHGGHHHHHMGDHDHHGPHPHGHHHHSGDHHHDHPEGPPPPPPEGGMVPRKGPKGGKGPGHHHHHHSHSKSHSKGHSKSHPKGHSKSHPKKSHKSHSKGRHHHGDHHHHHEGGGFGLVDFFGHGSSSSSSSSSDSSSSDSSSSDSSSSSEDSSSSDEEFDETWEEGFEEFAEGAEEWVSEEMTAMWEDEDEEVPEMVVDPEPALIEEEPVTAEIAIEPPVDEPALIVDEVEDEEPYTEQEIMEAFDTNDKKEVSRLEDGN